MYCESGVVFTAGEVPAKLQDVKFLDTWREWRDACEARVWCQFFFSLLDYLMDCFSAIVENFHAEFTIFVYQMLRFMK